MLRLALARHCCRPPSVTATTTAPPALLRLGPSTPKPSLVAATTANPLLCAHHHRPLSIRASSSSAAAALPSAHRPRPPRYPRARARRIPTTRLTSPRTPPTAASSTTTTCKMVPSNETLDANANLLASVKLSHSREDGAGPHHDLAPSANTQDQRARTVLALTPHHSHHHHNGIGSIGGIGLETPAGSRPATPHSATSAAESAMLDFDGLSWPSKLPSRA